MRIPEGKLGNGPFDGDDGVHIHSRIAVMAGNGHRRQVNRRK